MVGGYGGAHDYRHVVCDQTADISIDNSTRHASVFKRSAVRDWKSIRYQGEWCVRCSQRGSCSPERQRYCPQGDGRRSALRADIISCVIVKLLHVEAVSEGNRVREVPIEKVIDEFGVHTHR